MMSPADEVHFIIMTADIILILWPHWMRWCLTTRVKNTEHCEHNNKPLVQVTMGSGCPSNIIRKCRECVLVTGPLIGPPLPPWLAGWPTTGCRELYRAERVQNGSSRCWGSQGGKADRNIITNQGWNHISNTSRQSENMSAVLLLSRLLPLP